MNPSTPDSIPGASVLNIATDGVFKRILGISDYQMDAQKADGAQTEYMGVSDTYFGNTNKNIMSDETFAMVIIPSGKSSFDNKSKLNTAYVATPTQSTSTTNNSGASTVQLQAAVNSAQAALNAAATALSNANATQAQKQTAYNNATTAVNTAQSAYNKALAE